MRIFHLPKQANLLIITQEMAPDSSDYTVHQPAHL